MYFNNIILDMDISLKSTEFHIQWQRALVKCVASDVRKFLFMSYIMGRGLINHRINNSL